MLMLVAVFVGGEVGDFFEGAGEVTLRGKAEIKRDRGKRFVGISKELFGFFDFLFQDKIGKVFAGFLFEVGGKSASAAIQKFCEFLDCYGFGKMVTNVICDFGRKLRGILAEVESFHALGVIEHHAVV